MLWANFKPKGTAAASRGFLATARISCKIQAVQLAVHVKKLVVHLHCFAALPQRSAATGQGEWVSDSDFDRVECLSAIVPLCYVI